MNVSAPDFILSFATALIAHEMGHFIAASFCRVPMTEAGFGWGPSLFRIRIRGIDYKLRLLPIGAYVKMDMVALQQRTLVQQLFVLLAGIIVNLALASFSLGTFFGSINLALAIGNLFPIYQQDGWKVGMILLRRVFNRSVPVLEWSFTISTGLIALGFVALVFSSL